MGSASAGDHHTLVQDDGDSDDDYEGEVGSSVLCIKCRKALDDLSNIADALEKVGWRV